MRRETNFYWQHAKTLFVGLGGLLIVGCESVPAVPVQSSVDLQGNECKYNSVGYRICKPAASAESAMDSCIPKSEDASMRFSMGPDAYKELRDLEAEYFRLNSAPRSLAKGVVRNACLNMTARFSYMRRDEGSAMIECMNRVAKIRTCGAAPDYENLGVFDGK